MDFGCGIQTNHLGHHSLCGSSFGGTQTLSLVYRGIWVLPPEAGPLRWFSKLSADVDGSVDSFEIWVGGESHAASRCMILPWMKRPLCTFLNHPISK